MRRVFLAFFAVCLLGGIVDRLAITVGKQIITELQIDEEIRVTALLNHQPIVRNETTRRAAANRLIAQLLIKREMRLSRYPALNAADINGYLEQVRSTFGEESSFEEALRKYDLTEAALKEHLALQLATLRFIELRFRSDGASADAERSADQALDRWLEESRKQADIVYLDKSLQ